MILRISAPRANFPEESTGCSLMLYERGGNNCTCRLLPNLLHIVKNHFVTRGSGICVIRFILFQPVVRVTMLSLPGGISGMDVEEDGYFLL